MDPSLPIFPLFVTQYIIDIPVHDLEYCGQPFEYDTLDF